MMPAPHLLFWSFRWMSPWPSKGGGERSEHTSTHRTSTPASPDPLNPLASPGWRLEGIREILCLVHDLAVAKLHNAHRVCRPPLVGDGVFRDPEITFP